MKNFIRLFSISIAMITLLCIVSAAVTLYAPDGRTLNKSESEVDLYKSLGWYEYPVTKMYSLDGRTLICAKANVESNKKVGWYTQPMTKMYSADGRTLICPTANVEANKKVGWYTEPMATMYSLDGRTLICKKTNEEANKKVGWYTQPMTIMYSADGRTLICPKANVEANKKVGWYTEPVVSIPKVVTADSYTKKSVDIIDPTRYFDWLQTVSYPKIDSTKPGAIALKNKIATKYGKIIKILKNGTEENALYDISYTYSVYNGIICIIMDETYAGQYSEGTNFTTTFYYNAKTDKELSLQEYAAAVGVDLDTMIERAKWSTEVYQCGSVSHLYSKTLLGSTVTPIKGNYYYVKSIRLYSEYWGDYFTIDIRSFEMTNDGINVCLLLRGSYDDSTLDCALTHDLMPKNPAYVKY